MRRLAVIATVLATLAGGVWAAWGRRPPSSVAPPPAVVGVGALGRIEAGWKVIQVGPASSADGARVESLAVEEGSEVSAGAMIAVLDTHRRRAAALREAEAQVGISRAKLAQVKAGQKQQDVDAQAALVEQHAVAVRKAESELKRFDAARARGIGAVSGDEYDQRSFQLRSARATLQQAEAVLAGLKAVRPEDVAVAEAEVAKSEAAAAHALADLEATCVRSPLAGRVLKVHTRPGEKVGEGGIVEIGDTTAMHAVAEVYERDVPAVRIGQRAVVRLIGSADEMTGEVVHVGWKVGRRVVLDNDPVKDTDARVVEVRVKLDSSSSASVAGLSYARVEIRINTTGER